MASASSQAVAKVGLTEPSGRRMSLSEKTRRSMMPGVVVLARSDIRFAAFSYRSWLKDSKPVSRTIVGGFWGGDDGGGMFGDVLVDVDVEWR